MPIDRQALCKDILDIKKHIFLNPEVAGKTLYRVCQKCHRPTAGHPLGMDGKYPGYGKNRCVVDPIAIDDRDKLCLELDSIEELSIETEKRKEIGDLNYAESPTQSENEDEPLVGAHGVTKVNIAYYDEEQVECQQCGIKVKTSDDLTKHIREVHEPLYCDLCSYRASSDTGLKKHKLTHQKQPPDGYDQYHTM